jgi:hypothetical protein
LHLRLSRKILHRVKHLDDVVYPQLSSRHMTGKQPRLTHGNLAALDPVRLSKNACMSSTKALAAPGGSSMGLRGMRPI